MAYLGWLGCSRSTALPPEVAELAIIAEFEGGSNPRFGLSRYALQPSARVGGCLGTPARLTTDAGGPSNALRATVSRDRRNSGGIAAGSVRRGFVRVLPLQGCAGSDSSASDDEPGHRSGFLSFRVVRPFFVRARRGERGKPVDNPYLRHFSVSRSGAGLTTLPTLSAVGGRSRFGAFHSATALRGFFI